LLRKSGFSEQETIGEVIDSIGDMFTHEEFELFISYIYNTHRNKL